MTLEERQKDWWFKMDYLMESPKGLNDWEIEFIDSISFSLSRDKNLSFHQSSKLREIYNRMTS